MFRWYVICLLKSFDYKSRSGRKEFWMFVLFNIFVFLAASIFDLILQTNIFFRGYAVYGLVMLIPGLALSTRRLHDIGKNGWLVLITLIPLIGWAFLWILLIKESIPETNQYGPMPKDDLFESSN